MLLPTGQPAPDFTLADQDGEPVSLAGLRGGPVVLVFYPGDDTPVCTAQMCEIRDAWAAFREAGVTVLGLNPASPASHARFAERRNLPFRLLSDPGCRVARLYRTAVGLGPLSIPWRSVYGIDAAGVLVYARSGKPAPAEVLAALAASGGR